MAHEEACADMTRAQMVSGGGTTPVHQQECKRAQAPYSTPVSVNVTWPAEKR